MVQGPEGVSGPARPGEHQGSPGSAVRRAWWSRQTDFPASIAGVLKEMRAHKADLLRVLEQPEVPLHNNGRESDLRGYVKVCKISGGTRADAGRRCRDYSGPRKLVLPRVW